MPNQIDLKNPVTPAVKPIISGTQGVGGSLPTKEIKRPARKQYTREQNDQRAKQQMPTVAPVQNQPQQTTMGQQSTQQPEQSKSQQPAQGKAQYGAGMADPIKQAEQNQLLKDQVVGKVKSTIDTLKKTGQTIYDDAFKNLINETAGQYGVQDPEQLKSLESDVFNQYGVKDLMGLTTDINKGSETLQKISLLSPVQIGSGLSNGTLKMSDFSNLKNTNPDLFAKATLEYQKAQKVKQMNSSLDAKGMEDMTKKDLTKKETDSGLLQPTTIASYRDQLNKENDIVGISDELQKKAQEIDQKQKEIKNLRGSLEKQYPGATKAEISGLMYFQAEGLDKDLERSTDEYNLLKGQYDTRSGMITQQVADYEKEINRIDDLTKRSQEFDFTKQKYATDMKFNQMKFATDQTRQQKEYAINADKRQIAKETQGLENRATRSKLMADMYKTVPAGNLGLAIVAESFPDGENAGQCGAFINDLNKGPGGEVWYGNNIASKIKWNNSDVPVVGGDVTFNLSGKYAENGHVAKVISDNGDTITIKESNRNTTGKPEDAEKAGTRTISKKDPSIAGYVDVEKWKKNQGAGEIQPHDFKTYNDTVMSRDLPAEKYNQIKKVRDKRLSDKNTSIDDIIEISQGGKSLDQASRKELDKLDQSLEQLDNITSEMSGVVSGPIVGFLRSNNPRDTKAKMIQSKVTQLTPTVARGMFGEVGVLTDNDIALYQKGMPNMKNTEDQNKLATAFLIDLASAGYMNKIKSAVRAGTDMSGYKGKYDELRQKSSQIKAELGLSTDTTGTNTDFFDTLGSEGVGQQNDKYTNYLDFLK